MRCGEERPFGIEVLALFSSNGPLEASCLGNVAQPFFMAGCQGVIMCNLAVATAGPDSIRLSSREGTQYILQVTSEKSLSVMDRIRFDGCYLDASAATNPVLIEEVKKSGLHAYVTVNALQRKAVEAILKKFQGASLTLTWERITQDRNGFGEDALAVRHVSKLKRLFGMPVAYVDSVYSPSALLAVIVGATTVISTVVVDAVPGGGSFQNQTLTMLEDLVKQIRKVSSEWMRDEWNILSPQEWDVIERGMESLVAARSIRKGEVLNADMVTSKAAHQGIGVDLLPVVVGCEVKYDLKPGDAITFGLLNLERLAHKLAKE